jgi:CheY-like chemotaxis protein
VKREIAAGVRKFVERVLQDAGYATVIAANGPEVLRLAASLDTLDMVVTQEDIEGFRRDDAGDVGLRARPSPGLV